MARPPKLDYATPEQALAHRTDDANVDTEVAALFGLGDRLTGADRALLTNALAHPIDIDTIVPAPTAYQVLWLRHYDLLASWIDRQDRVWIRTTQVGLALIRPRSGSRRGPKAPRRNEAVGSDP